MVFPSTDGARTDGAHTDVLVRLVTPCTLTPMYLLVVGDTIKTACRNHKTDKEFYSSKYMLTKLAPIIYEL
jgi:hypothetical protein